MDCSNAGWDGIARVGDAVAGEVGSRGLWRRGMEVEVGAAAAVTAAVTVWERPMGAARLTVEESTVVAEAGGRSRILGNILALPFCSLEMSRMMELRLWFF